MLKQGSLLQVRKQEISREKTHIIICMCYYPRGIKKIWRDEYHHTLAPDRRLFKEWKTYEKQSGHEEAFKLSNYEARFELTPIALAHLERLSGLSQSSEVFLICQCKVGERCHREMLLLLAEKKFKAAISKTLNSYPIFEKRIFKI